MVPNALGFCLFVLSGRVDSLWQAHLNIKKKMYSKHLKKETFIKHIICSYCYNKIESEKHIRT